MIHLVFCLGEVLGRTTFFRRGKDDSPKLLSTLEKVERSDGSSMDVIFAANKYSESFAAKKHFKVNLKTKLRLEDRS